MLHGTAFDRLQLLLPCGGEKGDETMHFLSVDYKIGILRELLLSQFHVLDEIAEMLHKLLFHVGSDVVAQNLLKRRLLADPQYNITKIHSITKIYSFAI